MIARLIARSLPARGPADPVRLEGVRQHALETGRNRLLVAGAVLSLAFVAVAGRLVDLAFFDGGEPRISRATSAAAPTGRADIVDRNGVILATSLPVVSLYANPRQIFDAAEATDKLVAVLPDLDREATLAKLKSEARFVWVRRNLTPKQQYDVNRLGIPGLSFQRAEKRVYPHGATAAHILGLTDVDGRGVAGIEKTFETALAGGQTPVTLSLDIRVQDMMRQELEAAVTRFNAIGAAGVVLDVRTAEVLAMVSLPDFDGNRPSEAQGDAAFNRVTKGVYEMGSTFKLFTAAMALDSGTVGLTDGYDATKPIQISRFSISDYQGKKRWLSVPEILVYSSNIGSAKMALDVGSKLQREYLEGFGLLAPVAFELPEVGAPLIPHPWRDINVMTIAYGHGLAVSPLHLANGIASVVNGGILRSPTLVKRSLEAVPQGARVLSEETSLTMRDLMRLVVVHGTGKKANVEGYAIGGKTGTADKLAGRGYRRDARMASFVGAFPINDPRYVILAMVDEPKPTRETFGYATGGWVAAPVVHGVVSRLGPLLGLAPIDLPDPPLPGTAPKVAAPKVAAPNIATRVASASADADGSHAPAPR